MAMDELSAHLDRGWDLVQKGDFRGARASARRALEADKNSPEGFNLLGYVAAQEGDADEALEHYRSAMALDDGFIDPMLNAAEVLIHPLQEFDEAIDLCDEVLEFAEGNEEMADALLLKFDALLGKGDREAAKKVLEQLPEGTFEGPMYPFMLGRALFEIGEGEKALPHLQKAVEIDRQNPDAHYYLGLVLDEKSDTRGATLAFLEARVLDLAQPVPPWSLPREAFQKCVERGFAALPAEITAHLHDSLVLVSDAPGMEVVCDGVDPRVAVLLDATRHSDEPGPIAARVFLYQRNIERLCGGIEQLEDEITYQLTEEVKHVLEHRDREDQGTDRSPPRGNADGRARERERERERDANRERGDKGDKAGPDADAGKPENETDPSKG